MAAHAYIIVEMNITDPERFFGELWKYALLDGPEIYDRARVVRMLDTVPEMDFAARSRIDPVLMWMGSICLLHERLEM